ncbi:MAG: AEC family transporter [Bacillota bacterium]
MISNFLIALNTVGPIFIIVCVGYYFKKKGLVDDEFVKKANKIVYTYALPCTMFNEIYHATFGGALNPLVMVYAVVTLVSITTILCLTVPHFIKDNRKRCGAFIQSSFRSNFTLLGTVMSTSLFGQVGAVATVLLVPTGVLTLTVCSIVVFTLFAENSEHQKISIRKMLKDILINPVILGIAFAIFVNLSNIQFPNLALDSIYYMNTLTSPMALLALGAQLDPKGFHAMKQLLCCCALRLVVIPLVTLTPAILFFDFNAYEIGALFFLLCTPAGISNYSLSYSMGSDYEFTGQVIMLSSLLSFITMVGGIFVLIEMGIFVV